MSSFSSGVVSFFTFREQIYMEFILVYSIKYGFDFIFS